MKKLNKRGQVLGNINALIFGAISFVVLVVVLTIGAQITTTVKDTQTTDTASYNVSVEGEKGFKTFADYLSIIATIIILVVIVGLLIGVIALFARTR